MLVDGKVALILMMGNVWRSFYLDGADFEKLPEDVIRDIRVMMDAGGTI
jgi:hypothetical protein